MKINHYRYGFKSAKDKVRIVAILYDAGQRMWKAHHIKALLEEIIRLTRENRELRGMVTSQWVEVLESRKNK